MAELPTEIVNTINDFIPQVNKDIMTSIENLQEIHDVSKQLLRLIHKQQRLFRTVGNGVATKVGNKLNPSVDEPDFDENKNTNTLMIDILKTFEDKTGTFNYISIRAMVDDLKRLSEIV